jgi:NhaA family Na+:H+ antiporter
MALFFLLIGLELERELYAGELSNVNLIGAGILGGIGFTMSVFIALLAFPGDQRSIDAAKMAILLASLAAGILGYPWLSFACKSGRAHT